MAVVEATWEPAWEEAAAFFLCRILTGAAAQQESRDPYWYSVNRP